MRPILLTLAIVDLLAFGWTGACGVLLDSSEGLRSHFTWGVITTILFTFTHCLALFYLIGSELDVKEALAEHPDLARKYVPWAKSLKRRAFPIASGAALAIVVAALSGAHVHSSLLIEARSRSIALGETPPLRDVEGWWVHGALVAVAFLLQLAALRVELAVVGENRRGIDEINDILARREASEALPAGS